jgi:hypothetical protein
LIFTHVRIRAAGADDGDGIEERDQRGEPVGDVLEAALVGMLLPGVIGRQVEFAGAARDDGAAADAHEPFIVADVLAGLALGGRGRCWPVDFGQDGVEHLGLDIGIGLVGQQDLLLPFQLLQQVGLEVRASGDLQHFKNGGKGDVMLMRAFLVQEEDEFLVEVFQSQQRANTLIERVFVDDQSMIPLLVEPDLLGR